MTALALSERTLATHQRLFEIKLLFGVMVIDPEQDAPGEAESGRLRELVGSEACAHYRLLPIRQEQSTVVVAMVDPDDLEAIDHLVCRLHCQGLALRRVAVGEEEYGRWLARRGVGEERAVLPEWQVQEESPVLRLAGQILLRAISSGSSDIHIEPTERHLRIRLRQDGVLREAFEPLPIEIAPALVSHFKVLAELDIAERRLPQDGRLRRHFDGRAIDFRLSTLPGRYGEKLVLRLLDSAARFRLAELIADGQTLALVNRWIHRPHGLVLVTGPTGSGKTTTLYAALEERNEVGLNIVTAEDPIEYSLPGVTQVQVLREKGLDFARILRAFLRQDPDILLVGESRDRETIATAVEAALTGHLVLTSLHTNDAAEAIVRLAELGIEPYLITGALVGVLAQRLVRRLCAHCREPYYPNPERLRPFGALTATTGKVVFYRARSCDHCGGTGYKGRVGVYEAMGISEGLRTLIADGASAARLRGAALEAGMQTLLTSALQLARRGLTSLEEVERVVLTDAGLHACTAHTSNCRGCRAELRPEWIDCPYCTTPRQDG